MALVQQSGLGRAAVGEFRDGSVSALRTQQLQKSLTPDFVQMRGISFDISKGFFEVGIWGFDPCEVSQAVTRSEKLSLIVGERRAVGGLSRLRGQSPGSQF